MYFGNQKVGNCSLDVDARSAYGPETITIEEVGSYTYKYYVHNWSGYGTFQAANAVVTVYEGDMLLYTFNAPSGVGYYWNIFSIDGETGEFTITNTISSSAL